MVHQQCHTMDVVDLGQLNRHLVSIVIAKL